MLSRLIVYGRGDPDEPTYLSLITNDSIADFLFHWILGHEIGHFILSHPEYDAGVQPASQSQAELAADKFAVSHMPPYASAFGFMAINWLILELANEAKKEQLQKGGDDDKIRVSNPQVGHPNLLSRVYALRDVVFDVDSLHDEMQRKTVIDMINGAKLSSLCALGKGS